MILGQVDNSKYLKYLKMNFIEYLTSIDNLPKEGKSWYISMDTFASSITIDGICLNRIDIYGKLNSDESFEEMKISITFRYQIGKGNENSYHEVFYNLNSVIPFISNLEKTHFICKECNLLCKKNDKESEYCKECRMFKCLLDYKNEDSQVCSICQESTFRFRLECGHHFHTGCLANMNRKNIRCPNCRMKLSNEFIEKIFQSSYDESDSESDYE